MNFYHLDDIPEDLRIYFEPAPQIGLERTPEEYVAKMVEVFREVRRVLRKDGTCWVNLGDSYSAKPCADGSDFKDGRANRGSRHSGGLVVGLKPKDLVGVPWRVAFALQADGWYLRSDIIWHKPNPMPESVTDRPTKAHEYIFLLTKSERYWYDAEAISEPVSEAMLKQVAEGYDGHATKLFEVAGAQNGSETKRRIIEGARAKLTNGKHATTPEQSAVHRIVESVANARASGADHDNPFGLTRNKRTVWTVKTAPCKDAHFATFPPDLIKPCILAGCPVGGTVLDPFGGSGTTGMVALELGRNAILIELNPDYVALIRQRTNVTPGLPLVMPRATAT